MPFNRTITAAAVGIIIAFNAAAEVTVSVTLSGPVDEILSILHQLREFELTETGDGDTLELRIHSVLSQQEEGDKGEEPQGPALVNPSVNPETARAGERVRVMVDVQDPHRQVDTVVGSFLDENQDLFFDLYDNGTHGDAQAGDGTWTFDLTLPKSSTPGAHTITILAYDRHGDPVRVEEGDGVPATLETRTSVEVVD